MRHTLLILMIVHSTTLFAQEPDPDLFQTWYLHSVFASDATPEPFIVSEIEPGINPTLTIEQDLTFIGTGACNSFSGSILFMNAEAFETTEFSSTEALCAFEDHNAFENEYSELLQIMAFYSINSNENGMTLSISTPIFGNAIFNNFPLSLREYDHSSIEVFPNPSSSVIHINAKNDIILDIELFSSTGKRIEVPSDHFDTVDISHLPKGLYYMKVATDNGIAIKKVLKE